MKRLLALLLIGLASTALYGCDLIGEVPESYGLVGDAEITLEVGATYQEQGTTYPTQADVVITGTVDTSTIGTYTVTYDIPLDNNATLTLTRTVNVVDTTPPVITLVGGEVNLQVGGTFTDPGATATDTYDGDLTADIVASGTVDTSTVGSYTVSYDVSDSSGNAAATVTRTVIVGESEIDNDPVITLTGNATIDLFVGDPFTDPGATASDTEDGDITADIVVTGTVDTNTAGTYTLSYDVTDSAGNTATTVTRTVHVTTNDTPVITLTGAATIDLFVGDPFTDPGATASDTEDGDITANVVVTGTVDTATAGTYTLSYDVTDSSGNAAVTVTRTVNVNVNGTPVITLNGANDITVVQGSTFTDPGATANDTEDGDITADIVVTGTVDTNTLGTYTLTYDVTDNNGQAAVSVTLTVHVVENTKPVITLNGDVVMNLIVGDVFTDPGALADDTEDGDISNLIVVTGTVDTTTPGMYTLYYDVTDSGGLQAEQVERLVIVEFDDPPHLDVMDIDPILNVGDTYNEQGAHAEDDIDGDISHLVVITGSVDTNTAGVYPITYSITDSGGNTVTKTSNVQVIDMSIPNDAPKIMLTGGSVILFVGDSYVEPGFSANDPEDGDLTASVTVDTSDLDLTTPGTYYIIYQVIDSGFLMETVHRMVEVYPVGADLAPHIMLDGDEHIKLTIGSTYVEFGANAMDFEDGDISALIVVTGTVDTTTEGEYILTYTVTDSGGNTASIERHVEVVPDQAPHIEVNEFAPFYVMGEPYIEHGAEAWDEEDGDLTASIVITGSVNTAMMGHYDVTYTVTDSAGNTTVFVNTVTVTGPNNTPPSINLVGPSTVVMIVGDTYVEEGAYASDAEEGDISARIVIDDSNVDWMTPGMYWIEYYVEDMGFLWDITYREIYIFEAGTDIKPIISLIDGDFIQLMVGDTWVDPGAIAEDHEDGDITGDIVVIGTVITSQPGSYKLVYSVTDSGGNTVEVERQVEVRADMAPWIEPQEWHPMLFVGDTYDEQGAWAWDEEDGNLDGDIIIAGTVDTSTPGIYIITYTVTDSAGNTTVFENPVTVTVPGNMWPELTILGPSYVQYVIGDTWVDPGAEAWDPEDGDLTASIVIDDSQVDWNTPGMYWIDYYVEDSGFLWDGGYREIHVFDQNEDLPPIIEIIGPKEVYLNLGDTYTEFGATAIDYEDGDISAMIVISSNLDVNQPGWYEIEYYIMDSGGNEQWDYRYVRVEQDMMPWIEPEDHYPVYFVGDTYYEQGAYAWDDEDGDLSGDIVITGTVDTSQAGTYIVTYSVTDSAGNTAVFDNIVTVTTPENEWPTITLVGPDHVMYQIGDTWVDPGATATDPEDGDLTGSIVIDDSHVDWNTPGSYVIIYRVFDSGFMWDETHRWINIFDIGQDVPPLINLIGPEWMYLAVGETYIEEGATAVDYEDGDITGFIVITGFVDTSQPGWYEIEYFVMDSYGNSATRIRFVEVMEDQAPWVEPRWWHPVIDLGDTYVEEGAEAWDDEDGDLSAQVVITGFVDTSQVGTYIVTYCVTDSANNTSCFDNPVTVIQPGDEPPYLDLIGPYYVMLIVGDTYIEEGAEAWDDEDGDISASIIIDDSQVDWNTPGWYEIKYIVSDSGGWTVVEYRVIDIFPVGHDFHPFIDLNGPYVVELNVGEPYVEDGATASDFEDGDLTYAIVIDASMVDTSQPGWYEVYYSVTDSAGNTTDEYREVWVREDMPPWIEVDDWNPIYYVGDTYEEQEGWAYDDEDGDISHLIMITGTVDTSTIGTYPVTYSVTDSAGNTSELVIYVSVTTPGNTAPHITLDGPEFLQLIIGDPWTDPGATATDMEDGDLTGAIVIDDSMVDWNTPGWYFITYTVMDSGGLIGMHAREIELFPAGTDLAPMIDLIGPYYLELVVGQPYVEEGGIATDYEDGDLTPDIVIDGTVDTNQPGHYYINYEVQDSAGNWGYATRVVYVRGNQAPYIELYGHWDLQIDVGSTYIDEGAEAWDMEDGDLTPDIIVTGNVDTTTPGLYVLTYCVTDSGGLETCVERHVFVTVPGDEMPNLELIGPHYVGLIVGDTYIEEGATAIDPEDGDISALIVIDDSEVDWNTPGLYTIKYVITDSGGWTIVDFRVIDIFPVGHDFEPVITLLGYDTLFLNVGDTYTELGAHAFDVEDGDLTPDIIITNTVDTSAPGWYWVEYYVEDSAGNEVMVYRDVYVEEDRAPYIEPNDMNPVYYVGDTYVEAGAYAWDEEDGDISGDVVITGTVDTTTVGTNLITYTVTDSGGNTSTIDVLVIVTTPGNNVPVLTLNGQPFMMHLLGDPWVDPGATAMDQEDGDLTNDIVVDDTMVDWANPGWYVIIYTVTDSGGLMDIQFRDIQIVPTGTDYEPVITLIGWEFINLTQGDTYVEEGAIAIDLEDGDITGDIMISGMVDTTQAGLYIITYEVEDSAGNWVFIERFVEVEGDMFPDLYVYDINPILYLNDPYDHSIAEAWDDEDGDLTGDIVITGTVDTTTLGTYLVTFSVTDSAGNTTTIESVVTVTTAGNTAPTIDLIGVSPVPFVIGGTYYENGATATDEQDGDLTNDIVIDDSEVDWTTEGQYKIFYRVTDSGGITTEVYRNVDVFPTGTDLIPIITLNGDMYMYLFVGDTYNEPGAVAWDYEDGDLTGDIVITGMVDTANEGIYTIAYEVYDSYGNSYYHERIVYVQMDYEPDILPNTISYHLAVGDTYYDYGASAWDLEDGDLTAFITATGIVDTTTQGTYVVTYCVTDSFGHTVCTTTTVYVVAANDDPPVITLNGSQDVIFYIGDTWVEPGYTATDTEDGDITASVVVDDSGVDWTTVGDYMIRYTVVDSANWHEVAYRWITVVPEDYDFPPVLTLDGPWYIELPIGGTYTEYGVTATDVEDGDLTAFVVITTSLDTSTEGLYLVNYVVTDSAGNTEGIIRSVYVKVDEPPMIEPVEWDPTYYVGQTYVEQGAYATDDFDGDLSGDVIITGTVDTSTAGTYVVNYSVTDSAGQTSQVHSIVTVLDPD